VIEVPLLANGSKVAYLLKKPGEGFAVTLEKGDPRIDDP